MNIKNISSCNYRPAKSNMSRENNPQAFGNLRITLSEEARKTILNSEAFWAKGIVGKLMNVGVELARANATREAEVVKLEEDTMKHRAKIVDQGFNLVSSHVSSKTKSIPIGEELIIVKKEPPYFTKIDYPQLAIQHWSLGKMKGETEVLRLADVYVPKAYTVETATDAANEILTDAADVYPELAGTADTRRYSGSLSIKERYQQVKSALGIRISAIGKLAEDVAKNDKVNQAIQTAGQVVGVENIERTKNLIGEQLKAIDSPESEKYYGEAKVVAGMEIGLATDYAQMVAPKQIEQAKTIANVVAKKFNGLVLGKIESK